MSRPSLKLRLPAIAGRFLPTLIWLAWAVPAVRAQEANVPAPLAQDVSLKQLMTPEQFKAAGLRKLSPEELNRLENFLRGYREQTVQQVARATEERVNPAPKRDQATHASVVESAINGSFTGLTGRTRVVLKNGSIWQQQNGEKFRCNLESPDVVLVRNIFGYKMYVTGAPRWFYVKQIVVN